MDAHKRREPSAEGSAAQSRCDGPANPTAATPTPQASSLPALTVTAAAIRVEHQAAQRCMSEAVAHAIRAGELLIEAKAALPHGAFGPWLAANVEFSDRTARGYMQLAGLDQAKRQRVADMSLRKALAEAAEPREDFNLPADIWAWAQELADSRCLRRAYESIKDDPSIDHLDEGCYLAFRVHGEAKANARMPAESLKRARQFEALLRTRLEILEANEATL